MTGWFSITSWSLHKVWDTFQSFKLWLYWSVCMSSEKVIQTYCKPNTQSLQLGKKLKEWMSAEPGFKYS